MPTDQFHLSAQWSTRPQTGGLLSSGAPFLYAPISEYVTLDAKTDGSYALESDSPLAVQFGGVVNANVVIINCDEPITVQLTSTDGTNQVIPVDDTLIIISRTDAYTAINLVRTPATLTNIVVFLGEQA